MKKDLEVFENRSDDWLAKQRDEENKKSAWDLDEGKKLKAEHAKKHQKYLEDIKKDDEEREIVKKRKTKNFKSFNQATLIKIIIFIAVCVVLEYLGITLL